MLVMEIKDKSIRLKKVKVTLCVNCLPTTVIKPFVLKTNDVYVVIRSISDQEVQNQEVSKPFVNLKQWKINLSQCYNLQLDKNFRLINLELNQYFCVYLGISNMSCFPSSVISNWIIYFDCKTSLHGYNAPLIIA